MNTRTVQLGVHRNAHAKPPAAYEWIGKHRFEPEEYGLTFARMCRGPPELQGPANSRSVTLCGGIGDEIGHPGFVPPARAPARLTARRDRGYVAPALGHHRLPSSSGPGRGPLKAQTRVRFPLGAPPNPLNCFTFDFLCGEFCGRVDPPKPAEMCLRQFSDYLQLLLILLVASHRAPSALVPKNVATKRCTRSRTG